MNGMERLANEWHKDLGWYETRIAHLVKGWDFAGVRLLAEEADSLRRDLFLLQWLIDNADENIVQYLESMTEQDNERDRWVASAALVYMER